jgi:uncharacterized protein YhfF
MTIAREEIFGPVLSTIPFESEEEGIRLANETSYGLAAAVYTQDLDAAFRVARALRAGTVGVNAYSEGDITTPFGGYKQSGFGDDEKPDLMTRLGLLVRDGPKRATTSRADDYEAGGEAIPIPGAHSVILDGAGAPLCIIRTTAVEIRPYGEVDEAFAWDEGEGDRTLADWRRGHEWYFASVGTPIDAATRWCSSASRRTGLRPLIKCLADPRPASCRGGRRRRGGARRRVCGRRGGLRRRRG